MTEEEIVLNFISTPPLPSFPCFLSPSLSTNFIVPLLLFSIIFSLTGDWVWAGVPLSSAASPPLTSLRPLRCVNRLILASFSLPFLQIFSHPPLAAQVTCYIYSLRAGSLFVSVFASFQSGENNGGWQENRGNTLLIWPIPYTLWMAFAADGAPCAVWAFSESLWLRSSTPHFERMTHYGYTKKQQSWDQFEHLNTAGMKTSLWITCKGYKPKMSKCQLKGPTAAVRITQCCLFVSFCKWDSFD